VSTDVRTGLVVRNLVVDVATRHGWSEVLHGVSFEIAPGETLGLVGESGCGKSITAMSILRLLPRRSARIRSGEIVLDGIDLTGLTERELRRVRGDQVSMIFQEPMTSLDPAFTVGDQIAEMVRRHRGVSRAEARRRAVELIDRVGIPEPERRATHYPYQFSGGMRQRVMIAMAISCQPTLLIADEPTTALDVTVQAQILGLLRQLGQEHAMSILLVSHDLGVIAGNASRMAVMYAGEIVEGGSRRDILGAPQHPYTDALLRSLPSRSEGGRLASIPGVVPPLGDLPAGCLFGPRCGHFDEALCGRQRPGLRDHTDGRGVRCARLGDLTLTGGVP